MAFPAGFEPTASRLGILRSIRLSYGNTYIDPHEYTDEGMRFFTFCLVLSNNHKGGLASVLVGSSFFPQFILASLKKTLN